MTLGAVTVRPKIFDGRSIKRRDGDVNGTTQPTRIRSSAWQQVDGAVPAYADRMREDLDVDGQRS